MKARIALLPSSGSIVSRAISFFTGSEYTHVELCFDGVCLSTGFGERAALYPIGEEEDGAHWIDIELTDEQHEDVIAKAHSLVGAPYNLAAVVLDGLCRLGVPVPYAVVEAALDRRRHRTCTQLVAECYATVGVDLFPMPGFPWPAALLIHGGCQDGDAGTGVGMAGSDSEIRVPNPDSRSETRPHTPQTAGAAARACLSLGGAWRWPRSRPGSNEEHRRVARMR